MEVRQITGILSIFSLSLTLKLLLIPSYRSTDFQVHRNWLSIVRHLPPSQWYHNDTNQWTLDYPPFFAWFEYFLSRFACFPQYAMNALDISSASIENAYFIYFQRLSVIACDVILLYAIIYCALPEKNDKVLLIFASLLLMDAGLLIVDHIHFQYNTLMLALLLISIGHIQQKHDLKAAAVYGTLLMMKHTFLYAAPLYAIYLLRHYCYILDFKGTQHTDQRFDLKRFILLGFLVLGIASFGFVSILIHHPQPLIGFQAILSRLFPLHRGLLHAYWAPNIWALYALLDKLLAFVLNRTGHAAMTGGLVQQQEFTILPTITPAICGCCAILAMYPILRNVWKTPNPSSFLPYLVYCMICAYTFGYHVHEKAILQILIPFTLMTLQGAKQARIYRMTSIVNHIALFPLLFTPSEHVTKVLIAILHAILSYISLRSYHTHSISLHTIEKCYVSFLILANILANTIHLTLPSALSRYPFLPLLVTSSSCAIGNLYTNFKLYQFCRGK